MSPSAQAPELLVPAEQPLWDAVWARNRAAAAHCLAQGRLDPRSGLQKDPDGPSWLEIAVDAGAASVVEALIAAGASATQRRRRPLPAEPPLSSPGNAGARSEAQRQSEVGCPLWMSAGAFGVPTEILLALYRDPLVTASLTCTGGSPITPLTVVLCKRDPGPGKSLPEGQEGRDNLAECERLLAARPCAWSDAALTATLSVATRLQWECPASLPRLASMGCAFDTAPRSVQETLVDLAAARAAWQPPEGEVIACRATEWLLFFAAHPAPHIASRADEALSRLLEAPRPLPPHPLAALIFSRHRWMTSETLARRLHRDLRPAPAPPPRSRL